MKKRILMLFLVASLALSLLTPAFAEEVPNDTFETATEISVNQSYSDNLSSSSDVDYYQFTLSEDGYINISFSHEFVDSNNSFWTLKIYNAENKKVINYGGFIGKDLSETTTGDLGLPEGTYYVSIEQGPDGWRDYSDVMYHFKINYTASDAWEKELNDTRDTANEMLVNSEMHGAIMYGNDKDFYRFTLLEAGFINISFSHEFVDSNDGLWTLRLYNAENKKVINFDGFIGKDLSETTTGDLGLSEGTYYFSIEQGYGTWGSGQSSNVTYHFKINYTASDAWEKEFNDTRDTANEISVNSEMHGAIMYGNDKDFYQFTLLEAGFINISFSHELVDSNDGFWTLRLYNAENKNMINYTGFTGKDLSETTTKDVGLPEGTYYISIEQGYGGTWGSGLHSNVTYHFKINYTASDAWEKEFNNTRDTANEISLNSEIHGTIMYEDDNDFYQFTLASEETISISFSHEFIDSNKRYWNLYLYNSENKEIYAAGFIGNETERIIRGISLSAGKYFIKIQDSDHSDATYHLLINTASHTHTWGDWTVSKAATCTAAGEETRTCSGCGQKETRTTKALGHNYQNGVCTRCGAKDPNASQKPAGPTFTDVPANAWFAGAVDYAVKNGLMNGMGNNQFQPNTSMTRGMLVTVLWRYAGSPKQGRNTFSDVPSGKYYTDAVTWAAANGIVNGVGNGKFNPDGNITREQLVTILYRYCKQLGINTSKADSLTGFPDAGNVGNSAKDAMRWAVAEKLIGGKTLDASGTVYLQPKGSATRAEVATILMRFIENILK